MEQVPKLKTIMRRFVFCGVVVAFLVGAVALFVSNASQILWIVAGIIIGASVATFGWETSLTIAGIPNEPEGSGD